MSNAHHAQSSSPAIPLIVSADWLAERLNTQPDASLLVDVTKPSIYEQAHLPGAVHVNYNQLQLGGAIPGLPPAREHIEQLLSSIGLTPDQHVVAYDEEGGTRAARFLWILALAGHQHFSYLDGGIHAWLAADLPYSTDPVVVQPGQYAVPALTDNADIALDELLAIHEQPDVVVWDSRSPEEYLGIAPNSRRPGHIPGAVNYNWENAIDHDNNNLLRPLDSIKAELTERGITPDKQVIVHCRTHHRSSFTWLLAKHLGYPQVRAYSGSWAEWGDARNDTPVVTGASPQ